MISEPVVCLFPYVTEVLPSRSSPDIHDTCTRATNGNTWCPTKLRLVKWTMDTHTNNGNMGCPTKRRLVIGTADTRAWRAIGWVNLYQKFEIEKYTVCGKLILPKKMERHFFK